MREFGLRCCCLTVMLLAAGCPPAGQSTLPRDCPGAVPIRDGVALLPVSTLARVLPISASPAGDGWRLKAGGADVTLRPGDRTAGSTNLPVAPERRGTDLLVPAQAVIEALGGQARLDTGEGVLRARLGLVRQVFDLSTGEIRRDLGPIRNLSIVSQKQLVGGERLGWLIVVDALGGRALSTRPGPEIPVMPERTGAVNSPSLFAGFFEAAAQVAAAAGNSINFAPLPTGDLTGGNGQEIADKTEEVNDGQAGAQEEIHSLEGELTISVVVETTNYVVTVKIKGKVKMDEGKVAGAIARVIAGKKVEHKKEFEGEGSIEVLVACFEPGEEGQPAKRTLLVKVNIDGKIKKSITKGVADTLEGLQGE